MIKNIIFLSFLCLSCQDNDLSGYKFYGHNQPPALDGQWIDNKEDIKYTVKPKKISVTEFSFYNILARNFENEPQKNNTTYTFNSDGKVVNIKTEFKNINITYTESGLVETIEDLGEDNDRFIYEYDNFGNLVEFKKYFKNKKTGQDKTYFTKEDKNTILIKRDLGYTILREVCQFDFEKKIVLASSENETFNSTTNFSYSKTNKLIFKEAKSIPKDPKYKLETQKVLEIENTEYDKSDNIVSKKTKSFFGISKKKFSEENYFYDQFGNEIKYVISDNGIGRNKQSRTRQYTFDKNNNWITCETFNLDNELISKSTREIIY